MGISFSADHSASLVLHPQGIDAKPQQKITKMLTVNNISLNSFQKIFEYENSFKLEVTFKMLPKIFIHLELAKQEKKKQKGCAIAMIGDYVYGYKYKKNQNHDRVRSERIYFRKKIFVKAQKNNRNLSRSRRKDSINKSKSKQKSDKRKRLDQIKVDRQILLIRFAELKLMSLLNVGAKLARMNDGSDGILSEDSIQYFGEVVLEVNHPKQKEVKQALQLKGFIVGQNIQIAYSTFQRNYIARPLKFLQKNIESVRLQGSIKQLTKLFQQQLNRCIGKLDNQTNMMSAIQNHLNSRDIDRAMQRFEQNLVQMSQSQRVGYAQQMLQVLGRYNYYRNYEQEISSFVSSSRSSLMDSRSTNSRYQQNPRRRISTSEEETDDQKDVSSQMDDHKIPTSPASKFKQQHQMLRIDKGSRQSPNRQQQRISNLQKPRRMSLSIDFQHSSSHDQLNNQTPHLQNIDREEFLLQQKHKQWQGWVQRLKNFILDNNRIGMKQVTTKLKKLNLMNDLEIQVFFAQMLMENGKSRYAHVVFQRLIYHHRGKSNHENFICSRIYCMLAFLAYYNGKIQIALSYFQRALTIQFQLNHYSKRTMLILNNIGCLHYFLSQYEKSLLFLHRGFRLGQYCADYELLMRSNRAMVMAEKGMLKQAKAEMYKTYKTVQPYSNMEILCKFYSNLGYLELCDNVMDKAKANFENACQIQQKCLLPNYVRPSVPLHNNFAMYHCRKKQWRKAAAHMQKIIGQISEEKGIRAIQLHFNIGKIYKQLYSYDIAVKHFCESRLLLGKIEQKFIVMYRQKIESEIQKIEGLRIDQVSEESSYAARLSKLSKSLISNKHIETK